ncbi:MAG TPA: acetyl-CoA carboxylase carboxyltransferase subunit alpha [Terriglobales bacterium]|nr:acetyl-CoA carboxylase carboxyltransferase subunit alpha [Terriglobales bacterium]
MNPSRSERRAARAAAAGANGNETVAGAQLLLSMVERRWAVENGNGNKMESGHRAEQELEKIERQIAHLEATATRDGHTAREIHELHERVNALRREIAAHTGAWEKTELARHPQRPYTLDYVERIFTDWSEIHGDRGFSDDPALVCGMARFHGDEVMVIGHQKARDTKQKVYRNFGMTNPEGYRKALRAMKIAEKFRRPLFTFVDTPGAYPGLGAEERGQAEAIARNLREMVRMEIPIITTITGEGGSGGALAIAVADRVLMMENAIYSVISPEACAAIMWRDATKKELAAQALRITAADLSALGCVDGVVGEPDGGAQNNHEEAAALLDAALQKHYSEIKNLPAKELIGSRYNKFRNMAQFFRAEA